MIREEIVSTFFIDYSKSKSYHAQLLSSPIQLIDHSLSITNIQENDPADLDHRIMKISINQCRNTATKS